MRRHSHASHCNTARISPSQSTRSARRSYLQRLRRHGSFLLGTKNKQQKEYLRWNTPDRVSNIARVHKRSELSNVIERRERVLRCGDDDGRGIAPPTTPGILGNASRAPIENRFNSSRHHPATGCGASALKRDSCGFKRNTMKES